MLYLIRHAAVDPQPEQPSALWHLSPEGRAGADALAAQDGWATLARVYSSPEPKAIATAQRIAMRNALPVSIVPDLREVDRPWAGRGYKALARRYLAGDGLEGWELRETATERVRRACNTLTSEHHEADVAVASHGLALTLYLSELLRLDGQATVALWEGISFPDYAIVDVATGRLVRPFGG